MDLIDRQAAIDAIGEVHPLDYNAQAIKTRIEQLPSAQLMRPEGEWIERKVFDEPQGKYIEQWQSAKCSACGHYHTTPYLYYFDWFDWCPNCGADMRRKQNACKEIL